MIRVNLKVTTRVCEEADNERGIEWIDKTIYDGPLTHTQIPAIGETIQIDGKPYAVFRVTHVVRDTHVTRVLVEAR